MLSFEVLAIVGRLVAAVVIAWVLWRVFVRIVTDVNGRKRAAANDDARGRGSDRPRTLDERLSYIPHPDRGASSGAWDASDPLSATRRTPAAASDQRAVLRHRLVLVLHQRVQMQQQQQANATQAQQQLLATLRSVQQERFLEALDQHPATADREPAAPVDRHR